MLLLKEGTMSRRTHLLPLALLTILGSVGFYLVAVSLGWFGPLLGLPALTGAELPPELMAPLTWNANLGVIGLMTVAALLFLALLVLRARRTGSQATDRRAAFLAGTDQRVASSVHMPVMDDRTQRGAVAGGMALEVAKSLCAPRRIFDPVAAVELLRDEIVGLRQENEQLVARINQLQGAEKFQAADRADLLREATQVREIELRSLFRQEQEALEQRHQEALHQATIAARYDGERAAFEKVRAQLQRRFGVATLDELAARLNQD
jgi:hypothetical protein